VASNAGLNHGSKRRSKCTILSDIFDSQFLNAEPVFAGGTGRLLLESIAAFMRVLLTGSAAPGSRRKKYAPPNTVTNCGRPSALVGPLNCGREKQSVDIPAASAGDCRGEVGFVAHAVELCIHDPGALYEFELALDVGAEQMNCSPRSPGTVDREHLRGVTATPYSRPRRSRR